MKTTLTTPATLRDYEQPSANEIASVALSNYNFFCPLERLGISLGKIYKKYGGLDLPRLENSSMLKSITRSVRNYLSSEYNQKSTMDEDRVARKHLTYYLAETAFFGMD